MHVFNMTIKFSVVGNLVVYYSLEKEEKYVYLNHTEI